MPTVCCLGILYSVLLHVVESSAIEAHCSKPSANHGSFKCTDHVLKVGSTCKLTCDHGYHPSNSHTTIKCLSTSHWTSRSYCNRVRCHAPPTITNGVYKCPDTDPKFNDRCHLKCQPGFKPSSPHSNITCKGSGTWSPHTKCLQIPCPSPPAVSHGTYNCSSGSGNKPGSKCSLHCFRGYKPSNFNTTIVCLSSSKWSLSSTCIQQVYCQEPTMRHGHFRCSSAVYKEGSTCLLTCATGYTPSHSITTISCLSTSKWSASASCSEVQCPKPTISHGRFHCSTNVYKQGSTCLLECATGYKTSNSNITIKCLSTSKWSTSASCSAIVCPNPHPVRHGRYVCSKSSPFRQNDVCQLQCNHGYRATSAVIAIVCLSTSSWTSSASCEEMKCYAPPIISHGHYNCGNSTSYKIDTVCSIQCDQGYKPSSHSHISCVDEDHWSVAGTCEEIQCQDPPKIDNGQYHCSHNAVHRVDEVCHLQCNNGYRISSNSSEIYCLTNGSWSSLASCIEVACPNPPQIQHGSYLCPGANVHKLNDACHLICDEGFKPSLGQHAIYCQMQNVWTTPATCEEKRCDGLPKVDNGHVICNSSVHLINTACLIHCDPGFKLASLSDQVFCLEDETWASVSCVDQSQKDQQ